MKVFGLIINLLLPGLGSFFFGKYVQAIFQFIVWLLGVLLTLTGLFAIIGIPVSIIAWGWALATGITALSVPPSRHEKYERRLDTHATAKELPSGQKASSTEER